MRLLFISLASLTVIVLLVLTRPASKAELQPYPAAVVETTRVERRDVQPFTLATGRLRPARKARLRFEVSGRVVERYVEPGEAVIEGDPLLRIDDGDFRDTVQEAEARIRQEQQAIERDRKLLELVVEERGLQEKEVQRLEQLGRESLASQSTHDEALRRLLQYEAEEARLRYGVETARSRLQTRRADLNRAQRNLERTRLQAPFAGSVNSVAVEVGDYVSAGHDAVELVQLDKLDLYLEVTSDVAAGLALGQAVNVHAGEESRSGRIIALSADPDPVTNTHPLRVRLDQNGLLPGIIARVELPEPFIAGALTVPVTAVLQEAGNAYVFRIDDRRLVRTRVTLTRRFRDRWVVDGLDPGALLVSDDVAALTDGQEVNPRTRN